MKRLLSWLAGHGVLIFSLVVLLLAEGSAYSQPTFKIGGWEYLRLPEKSLSPLALEFADSLHGYFQAYDVAYDATQQDKSPFVQRLYYYRTSDGGYTWLPMRVRGNSWPDTLDFSYDPSMFFTFPYRARMDKHFLIAGPLVAYIYNYPGDQSAAKSGNSGFYRTTDGGATWTLVSHTPTVGHLCLASDTSWVVGQPTGGNGPPALYRLRVSYNGGRYFSGLLGDAAFDSVVYPFPAYSGPDSPPYQCASLRVDASDQRHWLAVPFYGGLDSDSNYYPSGLTTLATSDGGASWVRHHLPYDSVLPRKYSGYGQFGYAWTAQPQFVKGTPDVYLFPDNFMLAHEGVGYNRMAPPRAGSSWSSDANDGVSFVHSSDYGATWSVCSTFGRRRRGYEPCGGGIVYMTISHTEPITALDQADLLVMSRDDGSTWSVDSLTLNPSDIGRFDGRIITATDSNHVWIVAQQSDRTWIIRKTSPQHNSVAEQGFSPSKPYLLKIYPNPAANTVRCEVFSSQQIRSIDLLDMLGRRVIVPYKIEMDNGATLDTHLLPAGLYFIRVHWYDRGEGSYSGHLILTNEQ